MMPSLIPDLTTLLCRQAIPWCTTHVRDKVRALISVGKHPPSISNLNLTASPLLPLPPTLQRTMAQAVAAIDNGLRYLEALVDKPAIDYESIVVYSGWAVTLFEMWLL